MDNVHESEKLTATAETAEAEMLRIPRQRSASSKVWTPFCRRTEV